MPRSQLLLYLGLFVAMVALYAWNIRQFLRKRRLRRQLVTDGRLPEKRAKKRDDGWLMTVAVAGGGLPLFWLGDRLATRLGLRPFRAQALTGAMVFVYAVAFIVLRDRRKQDALVTGALRLEKQGDPRGAERRLREALAEAPTGERAGALGLVLFRQRRWEEAADVFRTALRIDPHQLIFLINLVHALSNGGRNGDALALVEEARGARPQEGALATMAAIVLARLGRAEEAAEQLRQGKELAEVATHEQILDPWSHGALMVEARKAVEVAGSTRAFPVLTPRETA
jgi:tetratricopeptide (TPR) repeat protein